MTVTERTKEIKIGMLESTIALSDRMSTSFGPKGLDKMIKKGKECTITNDGATILKFFKENPLHNILGSMSDAQDVNCGDGTTSVVLLACSLYKTMSEDDNIHSAKKAQALEIVKKIGVDHIRSVRSKVNDILSVALTTLNSKIAAKNVKLAKIAIDALNSFNFEDVKILKKVGGNLDDVIMHKGIVLQQNRGFIGFEGIKTVKLLIVQFCISAPKTNMDAKVEIKSIKQMKQLVLEEQEYLMKKIRKIKESGCNLLVVQKSLVRESISKLALHLFKKEGIDVIDGLERREIEYLSNKMNIRAVSDPLLIKQATDIEVEVFKYEENSLMDDPSINSTFVNFKTDDCCTVEISGVDQIVVDECERSLHDVLCVVRCLKNEPFICPGGCAIETGIGVKLEEYSGEQRLLVNKAADGFLALTHHLAKSAGFNTIEIVNSLKMKLKENWNYGISMRRNRISDMVNMEHVVQPSAVCESEIVLAIETVQMLLKIDDMLPTIEK
ncbi:TCPD [Enterospora canceri]|uniref:TCPD n=1 Tax=Enterospora canceri TaxID=1081671 RepID=A0A1Y1S7M8_9MICR|nr:TCPD [Enterospora canceri]